MFWEFYTMVPKHCRRLFRTVRRSHRPAVSRFLPVRRDRCYASIRSCSSALHNTRC